MGSSTNDISAAGTSSSDARACLVHCGVWLRRVIGEIVGEEFVEDVKSSLSLDLFGIPAYNGFCGFRGTYVAHLLPCFLGSVSPACTPIVVSDSILALVSADDSST
jgi:hypothetical protein